MKSYRLREQLHEELLQHLLLSRGVHADATNAFLEPDFERDSHDPILLPDMGVAVERILAARKNNESIAVWSDYDCDGIPGGVLLTEFLRDIGLSVRHYIPHRHKEGYGLNKEGLDELVEAGVTLIVTVDLGTTEHDHIAYAKQKGVDVIVTDHHLVPDASHLPPALAVINPKRPDSAYPFDGLCGAGVAWKLVQGVLQTLRTVEPSLEYPVGKEKWLLDLAGLGTLSDMVPLVGENRMLARYGLLVMRKARRPGLASLLTILKIKPHTLTEDDIGFMVAPRINAASRMDTPQIAARLLGAVDPVEAAELARTLNKINDERKGLVAATVKEVNKRLASGGLVESPVIVMGSPSWRPGILGLVASAVAEAHGKPVFLWGREGGEVLRGSCRSDGVLNVVELMSAAVGAFDHFGGHSASGGFSLAEDRVHELPERLAVAHQTLNLVDGGVREVLLDRELSLAEVPHAHRALQKLAPFGVGNAKPLFVLPRVSVAGIRTFGKQQDHLELTLEQEGKRVVGVSFFSTPQSFTKEVSSGARVDVVGHVETDWRGGPRVRVVDAI